MKYSIDGISDGKVIESIDLVKKAESAKKTSKKKNSPKGGKKTEVKDTIIVNYKNGTQDVFELSEEKLRALTEIMDKQAVVYVKKIRKINFVKLLKELL